MRPRASFVTTDRWVRGRILGLLRAAPPDAWLQVDAVIVERTPAELAVVASALERDGLVERDGHGRLRLPSARR